MGTNNPEARKVRCDACGCAFEPVPMAQRDGDIEYTFIRCSYCGKVHMVAVTDEGLRKNIEEYVHLAEQSKAGRLSEEEQVRMQALKKANVNREDVLRNRYLKEEGYGPF